MADNVLVDNGALTDFTVSADEASSGLVQRVKIAYSADGSDTHAIVDANGVLVNLGANNDIQFPGTAEQDIADIKDSLTAGGLVLDEPIVDDTGTSVPIKFVSIAATSDGDNTIVSSVVGKKLRVLGYVLTATGAGVITLQGTDNTAIGKIRVGSDGGGASYPGGIDAPAGQSGTGYGLEINCPAGVDVYGHLTYIEV